MTKILQLNTLQPINFEGEQQELVGPVMMRYLIIQQIKEKTTEFRKLAFIYLEKAFDRVRESNVLKILQQRVVQIDIINLIIKITRTLHRE